MEPSSTPASPLRGLPAAPSYSAHGAASLCRRPYAVTPNGARASLAIFDTVDWSILIGPELRSASRAAKYRPIVTPEGYRSWGTCRRRGRKARSSPLPASWGFAGDPTAGRQRRCSTRSRDPPKARYRTPPHRGIREPCQRRLAVPSPHAGGWNAKLASPRAPGMARRVFPLRKHSGAKMCLSADAAFRQNARFFE
jgi:hypothetical protein